ncbi:glycosyltransferase [Actinomyces sp. ZJ308]|uniref:glycosyltransferase n=1 Tax=Actinomyces sp. ZJ308 TaxID=2708342 RepID=UPI00326683BE
MVKVLAVVLGSEGDVSPFIVLGRRLAEQGHELVIAGFQEFAARVEAAGIDYIAVPGSCEQLMRRLMGDVEGVADAVRGVREMLGDPGMFDALDGAVSDVDVVMYNQFAEVVRLLSAAAGAPCVRVQVYPSDPCRSYSLVDPRRHDGTWRAPVLHRLSNLMMGWAMAPVLRAWRRRLGLSRWAARRGGRTLYQFSPSLNPPDPAWGKNVCVTGEWLDSSSSSECLDEQVEDFLGRGDPPLLVTFGSVVSSRLPQARAWIQEILMERGLRAIIVDPSRPGGETGGVLGVARVPYGAVLPRCRGMICHGSLGATGAGVRAGVPCLAIAFGGDQHFHAQTVCRNGLGPDYIDAQRGELTRPVLVSRIEELVNGSYDEAAHDSAGRTAEDPGVEAAVDLLLELSSAGGSRSRA